MCTYDDPFLSSPNFALRRNLDLYAGINIFKSFRNIPCKVNNIDIVLIRQNNEGAYTKLEHETVPGNVQSLKIVTQADVYRVATFAYEYARQNKRNKVTILHKANVL